MRKLKRKYKIFTSLALALAMGLSLSQGVQADSIEVKPYIAFGADLTKDQKKTVMDLLEVSKEDLADYETIQVT
ncbi:MAG: DUF1002 domain-containing protein, partial [Eubacterium sp.]|nr:DUF1002 domain-containing protein [Eubacterium sp.]